MLKLEIAGRTLTYRNAPELPVKVNAALKETQLKRTQLEQEIKIVKRQEKQLMKFLGPNTRTSGVASPNNQARE